jgi:superfamily II DNA or RNA helicase
LRFLTYEEARDYIHKLNLKNAIDWRDFSKSDKKPDYIPAAPHKVYKGKGWTNLGDWLGTGRLAPKDKKYWPYEKAKEFAQSSGIKSSKQWSLASKAGKLPVGLPADPARKYEQKGWITWGHFLGAGRIADQQKVYWDYKKARDFVHALGLKDENEWYSYCKSGKKPLEIPTAVRSAYKGKGWRGMGDWLGTRSVANRDKKYRSFEEARKYSHSLNLRTEKQWRELARSGKLPPDIPAGPARVYKKKGWKGMGDFLGTGNIAPKDRKYQSFDSARMYARSLGLTSKTEWEQYCRSHKTPNHIPTHPDREYQDNGWSGWGDWIGTDSIAAQEKGWSIGKVKELLRSLIESGIIYTWTEARLYGLLLTKGVLNLRYENRHSQFFKNLIEARHTEEGSRAIKEYAYSDSEGVPDLLKVTIDPNEEEVPTASSEELATLVNEEQDPLDYGEIPTVEQILSSTQVLETINVDEEAIQFFVRGLVNDLWKRAFKEEDNTIFEIKREGTNGNKFHDLVTQTFLQEYGNTRAIKIPNGYSFREKPTLMQKFIAYKISTQSSFGNFSGTGAGKTLSAVLSSRVIDSKMTVIVCPNDIVKQWEDEIYKIFPAVAGSSVLYGKAAFDAKYNENRYQYLVLNYDKFNQSYSPNLILKLAEQKIDFVILDEIHYAKTRFKEEESIRSKNLKGLLTEIRRKNTEVKILGLSATPVINNLMEGRSLLEMVTGKIYEDVVTKPTVPNAVTLYQKLSLISIREIPEYKFAKDEQFIEVDAEISPDIITKNFIKSPLAVEQFLTEARINEVIKNIDKNGHTIIYTEYVGNGIVEKLEKAVRDHGYKPALHTGSDHSGKKLFLDNKAQVLIASSPISIGVDGLQTVCNKLIINCLPWTNARYQQLIGRLIRIGQKMDSVKVIIIKASLKLGTKRYEYDQKKWNRIEFKRTLADCAVDGVLPERDLVTPEQAHKEAVRWLERLDRGEISTVSRRDLEVNLSPLEIKRRLNKYGDLSKQHQRINSEYSETTHSRMQENPEEWLEYHRQLSAQRKAWSVDPLQEIISRINVMSPRLKVGDFGCGEARLMDDIGHDRVISFDHVAINHQVIACDMKSVSEYVNDGGLDVVVFSLSLMGKNWSDYIIEAKRCLCTRGSLLIAHTTESLSSDGRLSKLRDVIKEHGFVIDLDEARGDFTFIEATKL